MLSADTEPCLMRHKAAPGARHAMGNCGPARGSLVWFRNRTGAICPQWCMCALWGTSDPLKKRRRKTTSRHECVCPNKRIKGPFCLLEDDWRRRGRGEMLPLLCLSGLTPCLSPGARGRHTQMGHSPPLSLFHYVPRTPR